MTAVRMRSPGRVPWWAQRTTVDANMSDKIELNRRRVLGGLVTIGAAGAAAGAGTFAYFSDTETSENTINAGTLDLNSTVDAGFNSDPYAPGDDIPNVGGPVTIETTYDGTLAPAVSISVDITGDSGLAGVLDLETARLVRNDGNNWDDDLTSGSPSYTHVSDLDSLNEDDTFGTVSNGDTVGLELEIKWPSEEDAESLQGKQVGIDVTFEADQPEAL